MSSTYSMSYVLLPSSTMPAAEGFRGAWRELLAEHELPAVRGWDEESAVVEAGGVTTMVRLETGSIPAGDAEEMARRSLSAFRAGGGASAPHVARLLVASTSRDGSPVEQQLRHTRVVAALARASRATGVFESGAFAIHDPDFYASIASESEVLPLMLWIGFSMIRVGQRIEILTLGMTHFELPELLLFAPAGRGNDGVAMALELCDYVISRGRPIAEGETVGWGESERLTVEYAPSPMDPSTRVMRVEIPA